MPPRRQFAEEELEAVRAVFQRAWEDGRDFGYQGRWEEAYTRAFCQLQGGGHADAVATGSLAVFAALQALGLPPGADVVVSPVTDPGSVSPAILLGHRISVADSAPGSFNVGPDQFATAITAETRAAVLTHLGGLPLDMGPIMEIARAYGILVIEDCSQAHGALYRGKPVGTFGDVAVFSTMFSKNHSSGGCGGLVYTRDRDLYWRIRSVADRGKPFDDPDFQPKDPTDYRFPALNLNLDEISCAIGLSTLGKLSDTIGRRQAIAEAIDRGLEGCRALRPIFKISGCAVSPFFHTVAVDPERLSVSKVEFARAVAAEGIDINPDYRYIVTDWTWVRPHLSGVSSVPNATAFQGSSFNILFHEKYGDEDVADIIAALRKVDTALAR